MKVDCDQIIIAGIFVIIAIWLWQNVFSSGYDYFDTNDNSGLRNNGPGAVANANANANANSNANSNANNGVRSSEGLGNNAMNLPVQLNRTPSTCYPQNSLTAADLLPNDESANISEFNQNYPIGEGILKGINFLSSGYHVGVNTVGQSLRNANRQLRSEPPNPQVSVSPWMNTSIAPDLLRRPLDVVNSCASD